MVAQNRGEQSKMKTLAILTRGMVERLDRVAVAETKSRSLVIREACEQLLRQKEREAAA